MPRQLKKSRKSASKPLTDRVLEQLAELAGVPDEQRKSFFESIRRNVQKACELDALAKGGMANKKGATLHQAALTLYDELGNLNDAQRVPLEAILSNAKFGLDRISGEGVAGLRLTTYQIARLLTLVTDKTPPRHPDQRPESRRGGRGPRKHRRFQIFVYDFLQTTMAAGGKLHNNAWGQSSSLADALMILVPYLPAGFDPTLFSLATLQRIKNRASRTLAQTYKQL
jgi:hypothetical protein